jgi:hypothetical protein
VSINIDHLTEEQLLDLNIRVVERLKMLSHMKAHAQMLEFRIGQRVTFRTQDGVDQFGLITKYNRKSVTVLTESGHQWNISPGYLSAAPNKTEVMPSASGANVFNLPSKGS